VLLGVSFSVNEVHIYVWPIFPNASFYPMRNSRKSRGCTQVQLVARNPLKLAPIK
jgi:hypothetical protein